MSASASIFASPIPEQAGQEQIEMIGGWTRKRLDVDAETVIIVRQVECRASSCSGIETVVAVLECRRTRSVKILNETTQTQTL
jgi:hypothetical protein